VHCTDARSKAGRGANLRMNTATIPVLQSREARFPDRGVSALVSLRQLFYYSPNNVAWNDEENLTRVNPTFVIMISYDDRVRVNASEGPTYEL